MRGENQNVPSAYPSYWYISCLDNAELSYSYKYSHRPALISVGTYWLRGPDPLPPEGRYASGSKSRRGFQIGITLMPCPLCVRNKLTSWSKRNFILGCDACWALAAPIPPPPGNSREFDEALAIIFRAGVLTPVRLPWHKLRDLLRCLGFVFFVFFCS